MSRRAAAGGAGGTDIFSMPAEMRLLAPARAKLHRPRTRVGHVSRNRVVERLQTTDWDVLLVTAPAGYGKSTMLAELAERDGRPTAWLTVDRADTDPVVLLAGIATALDQVEPIDWDVFATLLRTPISIASPALRGFGWILAARQIPFLLIVDDVHEIVGPQAVDVLDALVGACPEGSAIVLSGRDDSRLHRGSLRAGCNLAEAGLDELAFDADDTAALYAALGVELDKGEIAALVDRTEGWPLALYLAAGTPAGPLPAEEAISGDSRLMAEYFSDVFIAGLEPTTAEFLMAVSTLERVSGPLCDDVLERTGSADLLDHLERGNFLVIALDDRREWYRLHHLWAEFLSTELERRSPGAGRLLAAEASRWHEAWGDVDDAIVSAQRAGDLDRVERLVLSNFPTYGGSDRLATVERWLAAFSRDEQMARPLLMVVAGVTNFGGGNGTAAAQWLALAHEAIGNDHPDLEAGWTPPVARSALHAMVGCIPAEEMAAEARYAYEHLVRGFDWRPMTCLLRGAAAVMLGDHARAEDMFREGAFDAVERPLVRALNLAHHAAIRIEREEWDEAVELADEARSTIGNKEGPPVTCLVAAVHSVIEARRGNVEDAALGRKSCRQQLAGFDGIAPWLNLQTRIALARSAVITGNRAEASTLLDEAEAILESVPDAVAVRDQVARLRRSMSTRRRVGDFGPQSLTTAELRVLQFLPTHLSIAEIAERLFVSRNTVKAQSISIYRKLGTSSRGGAVDIARDAGLLD